MTRQGTRFDEPRLSARRRLGAIPGRRFGLALALAAVVCGCWGGVASADNSGQLVSVTIFPPGGGITTQSVSVGALQACPTYTAGDLALYEPGGTPAPVTHIGSNAWSVASVLGCLSTPVDMTAVNKVLVVQSGAPELSPNSQLVPADLASPSDFANTSQTPVIFSDQNNILYERPWRGGTDANAQDQVIAQDPASLQLEVFERTVLGATVTASANPVPVGGTDTFSVQAAGMGSGLAYAWNFDGAAPSSTDSNPSVTFRSAGSYPVTVQVTDGAGNVAQSQPLVIQVGSSPPTSTNPKAPTQGPTHSSGNQPGARPGQAPGRGSGASGIGSRPGPTRSSGEPAASTISGSGGTANGSGRSGSSAAGRAAANRQGGRGRARHPGARAVTPRKSRSATTTGPTSVVMGRLISDVVALPAGASPLVHAAPGPLATAPAARRPTSPTVWPALAAAAGVLALLALGAARELRWRRPWRPLPSSS